MDMFNGAEISADTMAADFAKATAEAEKILRENNILEPPIIPTELLRSCGLIDSRYFEFGEHFKGKARHVAGFLDFDERRIYVNRGDPANRQTFTIAHELGHWVLHRQAFQAEPDKYKVLLRYVAEDQRQSPLEQEANCFAANLLAPRSMLREWGPRLNFAVSKLAKLFIVSRDVIRYRMKSEKLHVS